MAERLSGNPEPQGIRARIRRKLTEEKAEVAGGVIAGSTTFIAMHGHLVAGGLSPDKAALLASASAAGMAYVGDVIVEGAKGALRNRRKK